MIFFIKRRLRKHIKKRLLISWRIDDLLRDGYPGLVTKELEDILKIMDSVEK